jgi:lipopolysaccharide transport system permease protein
MASGARLKLVAFFILPFGLLQTLTVHRHLLKQMVVRDLTARFAGTSIGAFWSLIHPLILLGLYTFVFSYIYRVRLPATEGVGFIPYVFCGLWPWLAFQEASLRSVAVIVDNAHLVKRVQFPSELLVISVILSSFLSQGVGFCLFVLGLTVWQGGVSPLALGFLVVPFLLQITLAISLGLLLSTGNVFLRDISQLAGAGFTVWFFLTPILYPLGMVPDSLKPLLSWNPLTAILALYRDLILSSKGIEWAQALYPLAICLVLLYLAQWVFQRGKGYFADYL